MYEKNENGQFLLDLKLEIESFLEKIFKEWPKDNNNKPIEEEIIRPYFSRYNGGWIKSVIGLNKKVTDGYSIKGEFDPQGVQWTNPGLYLDCSIDGSRKNQYHCYHLLKLSISGEWSYLFGVSGRYNWATKFWPIIEQELSSPPAKEELLAEKERLEKRLQEIDIELSKF